MTSRSGFYYGRDANKYVITPMGHHSLGCLPSTCKLQWLYLFRVERIWPGWRLQIFFFELHALGKKSLRSCDPDRSVMPGGYVRWHVE